MACVRYVLIVSDGDKMPEMMTKVTEIGFGKDVISRGVRDEHRCERFSQGIARNEGLDV